MARTLYCVLFIFPLGFVALNLRKNAATPVPSCSNGMYGQITSDNKRVCKNCSKLATCPHGTGLSALVLCTGKILPKGTDIHCVSCVLGKNFSSTEDSSQCKPCRSLKCHQNEAFTGKCTLEQDSTRCSGTCKRGFYSVDGKLEHCKPCSQCQSSTSKRIQKCKNDGMPEDKQCQLTTGEESRDSVKKGYRVYGHPALLTGFLLIITGLVVALLVVLFKTKKYKKKNGRSPALPEDSEEAPLTTPPQGELVVGNLIDIHDETDTYGDKVELPLAIGKTSGSASSGRPKKVSFTRQHSSPESHEERKVLASNSLTTLPNGTCVNGMLTPANLEVSEMRNRSQSSCSAKKFPMFRRQISNPLPEHQETKGFRKSKTFSSFTTVLSGQRKLSEEETPILMDHENSNVITMKNPVQDSFPETTMKTLTNFKVDNLNAELHMNICRKLNLEISGKDWQTLAGKMLYPNEFVQYLKSMENPTEKLLSHWGTKSGNDMAKLVDLLKQMERGDIVDLVEEELLK